MKQTPSSDEKLIQIKYRNWLHGIPPKRIKLDVGGWAGENTWKVPQGWHCKPFADANTYGLELVYTWQTTCTVTCDEKGHSTFEGDFSQEKPDYLGKDWHPFAAFAPYHFGYVSMVDIQTPLGHNLMVMPHPRFYADKDGSTPCAVPGMLEMDWWPEIFFIVFKAPLPGQKLVFKHGDPIAQFLVLPRNIKYDIKPMTDEESTVRAQRQSNLENNWNRLCTRVFYCEDENEFFDNKYKVLSTKAKREGNEAVEKIMDKPKLISHWYENPQVIDHRAEDKKIAQHNPWSEEELRKNKEKIKCPFKSNLDEVTNINEIQVTEESIRKIKKKKKTQIENTLDEVTNINEIPKLDNINEIPQVIEKEQIVPDELLNLTNEQLEEMYDPELLKEVDDIISKNILSEEEVTDAELERLIAAFKMTKRHRRQERSQKLKDKADPKIIMANQKHLYPQPPEIIEKKTKKENVVLGHRIEKLL